MERYDPILLNNIKNQSVSTMEYKEHMRTVLSPEYPYLKREKEIVGVKSISVKWYQIHNELRHFGNTVRYSGRNSYRNTSSIDTLLRRPPYWIDLDRHFGTCQASDPPERRVPLRGSAGSTGLIRPMERGPGFISGSQSSWMSTMVLCCCVWWMFFL